MGAVELLVVGWAEATGCSQLCVLVLLPAAIPLLWSVVVSQTALPTIPVCASHCWPHCTLGCHGLATHEVLSTSRVCELH